MSRHVARLDGMPGPVTCSGVRCGLIGDIEGRDRTPEGWHLLVLGGDLPSNHITARFCSRRHPRFWVLHVLDDEEEERPDD